MSLATLVAFCLGGAVGQGDGSDGISVSAILAEKYQWQEQKGVVGTPSDKRPVGTVPETRQQEDNERVANDNGFLVCLFMMYALGYNRAAFFNLCKPASKYPLFIFVLSRVGD